ncbi:DUF262 domain-containing protein [Arcobacter sp. CECT 8989]|uniref:DUF262 domain-containing protein n=1 Tax=Arcobacter sp. CECT 8989 TaxID=2044509 RepID=UPI002159E225|nr:DUF262 domain-containing protein [Arcobacter sp. CECT 8989]
MLEDIKFDEKEEFEQNDYITRPFSPKDIKVTNSIVLLPSIINRLNFGEIDLSPDFQRNSDLWNKTKMSRLIESILLKLPLPIFYFDVSDPDKWLIVDGLQRLSTIKRFFVDKKLKLSNLEFLTHLDGKSYDDLDRSLKRTIDDTELITYQIEAQTPKEVRYSIFHRINTGGMTLNAQEIRQALNQKGSSVDFLKEICENDKFINIVGVSPKRMLDRELALRFIAFKLTSYKDFSSTKMGAFLDDAMEKLDSIEDKEELQELKIDLLETLVFTVQILGENHRFSRAIASEKLTKTLNRSLFDVITICFSNLKEKEKLLKNKSIFLDKLKEMLLDEKGVFYKAITEGTSDRTSVENRFIEMDKLISEVINEKN